ncbi:hypothetical protein DK28_0204430 [Peptococcaceae bacterium SCADC1_2_3]|jgi:hypothetical protein|nr:hypothetical protein DK28_0204430 [Peptococcaceae bacterium SCADC1_2_3]KFI34368.1 hypothetical protein HY00_02830 [Peptococcaceae bacterium SCADC1_2_3]
MEYETLERDFITRTLKIICQYEKNIPKFEQFEVTLLINCLVGLLILPKERFYKKIPNTPINQLKDWGLRADHIIKPGMEKRSLKELTIEKLTLKEVVRRMRNSVSHFKLEVRGDGNEITHLVFSDQHIVFSDQHKLKKKDVFEAVIPVECLKTFVTKLAQSV